MESEQYEVILREIFFVFMFSIISYFLKLWVKNRILKSFQEIFYDENKLSYRVWRSFVTILKLSIMIRLIYLRMNMEIYETILNPPYEFLVYGIQIMCDFNVRTTIPTILIFVILSGLTIHLFFYYSPKNNVSWQFNENIIILNKQLYDSSKIHPANIQIKFAKKLNDFRSLHRNIPNWIAQKIVNAKMSFCFEDIDEYSFIKEPWRFALNLGNQARRDLIIALELMEFLQNISLRFISKLFFNKLC